MAFATHQQRTAPLVRSIVVPRMQPRIVLTQLQPLPVEEIIQHHLMKRQLEFHKPSKRCLQDIHQRFQQGVYWSYCCCYCNHVLLHNLNQHGPFVNFCM